MGNDVVVVVRMPRALRQQVLREARLYKIPAAELIRKKLQAVSLSEGPVVRMLTGRVRGTRLMRVEVPLDRVMMQQAVKRVKRTTGKALKVGKKVKSRPK